jgi:hypothetical protein
MTEKNIKLFEDDEEIKKLLIEYPYAQYPPCIYFLCHEDRIMYIGESKVFHYRIAYHLKAKRGMFNKVFLYPCPNDAKRKTLERKLIHRYKPPLNGDPSFKKIKKEVTTAYVWCGDKYKKVLKTSLTRTPEPLVSVESVIAR